jgi:L-serine dehydratase
VDALSAAGRALAGVEARVPAGGVIDAMRAVGAAMPSSLRETGRGGIAASPTAEAFRERFFGK